MPVEISRSSGKTAAKDGDGLDALPRPFPGNPQNRTGDDQKEEAEITGARHDAGSGAMLIARSQPSMPVLHGSKEGPDTSRTLPQYAARVGINKKHPVSAVAHFDRRGWIGAQHDGRRLRAILRVNPGKHRLHWQAGGALSWRGRAKIVVEPVRNLTLIHQQHARYRHD